MIDISVSGLYKAYEEDKNILEGLSFEITAGERVGLLGRNGAGKTTLLRILTNETEYERGDVVIHPGRRLGLISQIPVYPPDCTTEDVLKTAHAGTDALAATLGQLAERMVADSSPRLLREYDKAQSEFLRLGGYDTETARNRVANGLLIPPEMRGQLFSSLSGGEKTRVNLARLILEDTDVLLLDEPTNHLDMRATEWLEDYLVKFRGTVLVVSHDRYFLDRVVTRTIEIVGGKAEFYGGSYSFFVAEKLRRQSEQMTRWEREQAEAKRLKHSAGRLAAWGTGNKRLMQKSKAIEKRIERLTVTGRPTLDKKMKVRFSEREFRGDEALVMRGISKSYGSKQLFSGVDIEVTGGERIALIGDNGTGKSTLLRLIVGEEQPDEGSSRLGPAIKAAFLPQIIKFDDPYRSVLDTMLYECSLTHESARNRLGAFRFSGEDVYRPVGALSGGEQSRLRLCMLMKDEINLLILDEPTNHLDLQSREWIEEALEDYGETLLFVSHDRYFIDRFATRVWECNRDGTLTDFRGSFSEYREYRELTEMKQRMVKSDVKRRETKKTEIPREKLLAKTEREIDALELKIKQLDEASAEYCSDYQKLLELSGEKSALEAELVPLYERWEELSE